MKQKKEAKKHIYSLRYPFARHPPQKMTNDRGVDDGNVPTMGGETTATFPTAASYAHSSNIYLFLCEL